MKRANFLVVFRKKSILQMLVWYDKYIENTKNSINQSNEK